MKILNAPAFQHEKIADERIDSAGIPIPQSFANDHVPLVVSHDDNHESPLQQISPIHGRSYLVVDTKPNELPWQDQHGNAYQAITTKGNNLTQHLLLRSATAPSGFLPYGLQEGDALRRVARASRIMRAAGIDTERPIGVYQPKELAHNGELVDVSDYKRLVIESMVKRIKSGQDTQNFTLEEVGEAAEVLDEMDFFVTLRATSTAARIGDLVIARTEPLGHSVPTGLNYDSLTQVFNDYNSYALAKEGEIRELGLATNLPAEVHPDTEKDALEHYFEEILPKLMAKNLGLLHSLGLLHQFPHTNNFTGLGGIVDLDSVKGGRLRMKDPRDRELQQTQIFEKVDVSIDTLWRFGRYSGHQLDWNTVSRHARENFTEIYMQSYDGALSANDRMKMIFVDAAFKPAGNINAGSTLEIESLEKFYPGSKKILDDVEKEVMSALSGEFHIRSIDIASMLIDRSRDPYHIWDMEIFTRVNPDENGEILMCLGVPPSDEEILDALPEYYEAEKDTGQLYSHAAHMINLLPLMKLRILGDLKKRSDLDIIQAFVENLPESSDVNVEEVRRYLTPIQEEILKRVESKIEKPDFDEFWAIGKRVFKEKILDSFDRSIIPKNNYIQAGKTDIESHVAFWQLHQRKDGMPVLEHTLSGVTSEQIKNMLAQEAIDKPELVNTPEEVLQIEPQEDEEIRLVVTDGDINNIIHYRDYGGEYEDINYRQYQKSDGKTSSKATEAIYLIQKDDDTFKRVYKRLIQ